MKEIKNIALVSAAGSGKTHALTKRFLFLYLHKNNYLLESLYAITFTNAAAYEMKSRIIQYLDVLTTGNASKKQEEDILKYFTEIFSEQELKKIGWQKRNHLLNNLSDLNVSTFHSMFASFLSVIPFRAGILPGYKIIDEPEERLILDDSIDCYFEEAHKEKESNSVLLELVHSEQNNLKKLITELYERLKPWFSFLLDLYEERERHKKELSGCEENLLGALKNLLDFVYENITATHTKSGKINSNWQGFLDKIERFIEKKDDVSLQSIISYFTDKDGMEKDYFNNFKNKINDPQRYNDIIARIKTHLFSYLEACSNNKLILHFQPLIKVNKIFQTGKKKRNVISFSDIEDYILNVFKEEPDVDYLYFKLGADIKHIMIDEFQDTSYKQIDILEPILDEITAYNPIEKSLFYVGDPNQAIFRWRQGAPELFEELKKKYQEKIFPEFLDINYRTKKEIIDFVNKILDKEDKTEPKNTGGWIRIEELGVFDTQDEAKEIVYERVVKIIKDLKNCGYKESDIAILTRKNDFAANLAGILSKNRIPCISKSRASIMDEPDVQLVIHLLKFLDNPEDDFSLLHILESSITNLKEDLIYTIARIKDYKKKSLYLVLLDHYPQLDITKKLQELLSYVYFMNPYQIVFNIYKSFGLEMSYPIATLLDAAVQYLGEGYGSLSEFINWLEQKGTTIEIKEAQFEGVRIMTIHKAKGLEFEIVILPETNFESASKTDKIIFSYKDNARPDKIYWRVYGKHLPGLVEREGELERIDDLNLLYVALTRAKTGVYMLSYKNKKNNPGFWINHIKDKLKDEPLPYDEIPKKTKESEIKKEPSIPHKRPSEEIFKISEEREIYSPTERGIEVIEFARRRGMKFGDIIHKVLNRVEWLDGKKIDNVVDEVLKFAKENLIRTARDYEETEKKLKFLLLETLTDPDLKFIFYKENRDVRFKNELTLYFEDGKYDVSAHIDRVIFEPDKITIIDYKTGGEKLDYKHQLQMYRKGIKAMFPNVKIQLILLYLENKRGEKLKFIE